MVDVASIAKKALDSVAAKLTGVVHEITLSHTASNPAYDASTGTYTPGTPATASGRAIDESGSLSNIVKSVFPYYVITGPERILFLEGLNRTPVNGDVITSPTLPDCRVVAVQSLLGVNQAFRVIVL